MHFLLFAIFAVLLLMASCAHSASNTVLVLGDSLSAEYGLQRGTGWVVLLENKIKTDNINAKIVNASISGDTTSGGKNRLPALLQRQHPSVVVIELGANDGLRGLPLTAAESNLSAMILVAKKAKAKVLLVGVPLPPNYGREYNSKFAAIYTKLAKSTNSALVPSLVDGFGDKPHLFQTDGLHPTADAQALILNNVWPHIKPLLK